MEISGLSPMTPWSQPGARWHVHLPVDGALAGLDRVVRPVLARHADRLQVLPLARLHCTLAWIPQRPAELARGLGIQPGEIGAELRRQFRAALAFGESPGPVPVTGLAWARGGPVLTVDGAAAMPLRHAARTALAEVVGTHFVKGPAGDDGLHIALGYARVEWSAAEVAALDAELRAVIEGDLLDIAITPALLLCLQDTFGDGGLDWTDEVRLTR